VDMTHLVHGFGITDGRYRQDAMLTNVGSPEDLALCSPPLSLLVCTSVCDCIPTSVHAGQPSGDSTGCDCIATSLSTRVSRVATLHCTRSESADAAVFLIRVSCLLYHVSSPAARLIVSTDPAGSL